MSRRRELFKGFLSELGQHYRKGSADGMLGETSYTFYQGWDEQAPHIAVIGGKNEQAKSLTDIGHILHLESMPELAELKANFPHLVAIIFSHYRFLPKKHTTLGYPLIVLNGPTDLKLEQRSLFVWEVDKLPTDYDANHFLAKQNSESDVFICHGSPWLQANRAPFVSRVETFILDCLATVK